MEPTLRDALPEFAAKGVLALLQLQIRDEEYFKRNYTKIDPNTQSGSFGTVYKVKSHESESDVFAIKKVVIKEESTNTVHNMPLQVFQECYLPTAIGPHANIIHSYPEKNWIVLSDKLDDAGYFMDLLEKELDLPLTALKDFIGTEVYMVFDWYDYNLDRLMYDGAKGGKKLKAYSIITKDDSQEILRQILSGLQFLHKEGVIHNDLKPNNILIKHYLQECNSRLVVVADMGLTRWTTPSLATPTPRYHRLGCMYDAPDQEFTTYIDIWSCGLMAFQLIFVAKTGKMMQPKDVESMHIWAKDCNFRKLRKFITDKLQGEDPYLMECLVQCLHFDPKLRPTATVVYEIFANENLYKDARQKADQLLQLRCTNEETTLLKLMKIAGICCEEMIFIQWYTNVFLDALIKSQHIPPEFIVKLQGIVESHSFPLAAAVSECNSEQLQLIADVLCPKFSPA